jgi:peptidoglycan hydrolase-like protein with peptidoglycan-binding domain
MKRLVVTAGLILGLTPFVLAQQNTNNSQSNGVPSGTKVVGTQQDKIVKPVPKGVKLNKSTVEAAQKALADRGYQPGPVDGIVGPKTQAATSKFQADKGLKQTGQLNADTLTKLDVGGPETLSTAPGDVGRGGKAFGHDIKEGHPVAAGKSLGEGTVDGAKAVGKGTESLAKEGALKVGSGLSSVGSKIDNTVKGDNDKDQTQSAPQNQNTNQNPQ